MATTKVIPAVIDLQQSNSESGLRMPSGSFFSGTPSEGMMRNDTGQESVGSASTMQHYNGTEWKNFVNKPDTTPFNTDILIVAGGGGTTTLCGSGGGGGGGCGGRAAHTRVRVGRSACARAAAPLPLFRAPRGCVLGVS